MDNQANIDLVKQCYDAYLKGDMPRLLSFMAPDIDWQLQQVEGVPFSGKRRGVEQVTEFVGMVAQAQEPRSFEPRDFVAQGDMVVVMGHYDWVVKATGAEFGSDFVHCFTIRDGKVTAFKEYMDTYAAAMAYFPQLSAAMGRARPERPALH